MASRAKERFHSFNTLSVLLSAMRGRVVVVETTNDCTITGKVVQCDGFGNLCLINAKIASLTEKKSRFDEIHVKASKIRYVHLPDDVEPLDAVKFELKKKSSEKTFKTMSTKV